MMYALSMTGQRGSGEGLGVSRVEIAAETMTEAIATAERQYPGQKVIGGSGITQREAPDLEAWMAARSKR